MSQLPDYTNRPMSDVPSLPDTTSSLDNQVEYGGLPQGSQFGSYGFGITNSTKGGMYYGNQSTVVNDGNIQRVFLGLYQFPSQSGLENTYGIRILDSAGKTILDTGANIISLGSFSVSGDTGAMTLSNIGGNKSLVFTPTVNGTEVDSNNGATLTINSPLNINSTIGPLVATSIRADNFISSGNNTGVTTNVEYQDWSGGFHTLIVENGLIVAVV